MAPESIPRVDIDPAHRRIHPSVFVADTARVVGQVTILEDSSVWYSAVIRADLAPITIGRGCSIQDGAVLHVDSNSPCTIGDFVTIGHQAMVHGATVGDHVIVGIGAVILSRARVGSNSIIGAGAVVPEGKEIPPNSVVMGVPGKVVREVSPEQAQRIQYSAERYIQYARVFKRQFG